MSELKNLISKRGVVRTQVTKYFNSIENDLLNFSTSQKNSLLSKVKLWKSELKEFDNEIELKKIAKQINETELEQDYESCLDYSEKIAELTASLEESLKVSATAQVSFHHAEPVRSQLKRPAVPLPTYNSLESECLERFLHDFESTTDKYNYSSYDKLLLLKGQIKGRALILINSLETTEQSYECAKSLLTNALASPTTQRYNVIKRISEMKLTFETDPFEYIAQLRSTMEIVKTLDINVENFLQYFYWNGLNDVFKNQLIQITNNSKPSLKEIVDNFFNASERYLPITKKFKDKKSFSKENSPKHFGNTKVGEHQKFVNLATTVNYDQSGKSSSKNIFSICPLCEKDRDNNHSITRCMTYSNPNEKVDKLKKLGGCLKCADTTHKTELCKFRFNRRCIKCSSWHFAFLCNKFPGLGKSFDQSVSPKNLPASTGTSQNSSKNQKPIKSSANLVGVSEESSAGSACLEVKISSIGTNSILPTFSCKIENSDKLLRGLKDSGCQGNLITQEQADLNNFNVVRKNINLTLVGFNVSKTFITNAVEIPINFGGSSFMIEAVIIPSISTELTLLDLKHVVDKFQKLGYKFADTFLTPNSEKISSLDIVIGTESAFIFRDASILFGPNECPSVYYNTPAGIMLTGKLDDMLENMGYLKELSKTPKNSQLQCSDLVTLNMCFRDEFSKADLKTCNTLALSDYISVQDKNGNLIESKLQLATEEALMNQFNQVLNYELVSDDSSSKINDDLVNYALENTYQSPDGRLVMPLLWNNTVAHLLAKNRNLSEQILKSSFKKLSKNKEQLLMIDKVFREQEELGIIEKIDNLSHYLEENPHCSFLPHMPVFRMDRSTSKCRVVYLSSLKENDHTKKMTVSHNQAILPGPCINSKLSTALLAMRFDSELLCFDFCKAFLQILLDKFDSDKLLFLWFRNVNSNDFEIIAYKNKRLPFGLRCSPAILMLAMYKMLIIDSENDSSKLKSMKKLIYHLLYMDNGAFTTNDSQELFQAYEQLKTMFTPYKFELQQFITNNNNLQIHIDEVSGEKTPSETKLFGLRWDRENDTLSTNKLNLDESANTKRLLLKSIASNFDLFNFMGPLLNRARVFMHKLQCDQSYGWDTKLSEDLIREWQNIAKQLNAAPVVKLSRFVGRRDSTYELIAFSDSSKNIYGTVIFIKDLETNSVNFLMAKNRMIGKNLESKSIPSLELQGICLGVETLIQLHKELTGPQNVVPVNIKRLQLFSDSLVCLNWLNSYSIKLDKMSKQSVFIMNRLNQISKLCEHFPVTFSFVSGIMNPADFITRPMSYVLLNKSNFWTGPEFLKDKISETKSLDEVLNVTIPNPKIWVTCSIIKPQIDDCKQGDVKLDKTQSNLDKIEFFNQHSQRFSSFSRMVGTFGAVFKFINILKTRVKNKHSKDEELLVDNTIKAFQYVILNAQKHSFPDVFEYFETKDKSVSSIPNVVTQLNVFPDRNGILRVKSKMDRNDPVEISFPILMSNSSHVTSLVITAMHKKLSHAGCYSVLSLLKKQFYIPKVFSAVKKLLQKCIHCARVNRNTVKLNQNSYKEFRLNPPEIPYRYCFMDHLGPYYIKDSDKKVKVWLLLITCLWSRAVNIKICLDMTVKTAF